MFEGFIPAFLLIALSEFGDKSQLAAILLGARYRHHHRNVFLGTMTAFAVLMLAAILFGAALIALVPEETLKTIAAFAFVVIGVHTLVKREKENVALRSGEGPFINSFTLIALSELGDKTQLAVILLVARMHDSTGIFLGALAAEALLSFMAIFIGKEIARRTKMHAIRYAGGIIFVLFGIAMLSGLV